MTLRLATMNVLLLAAAMLLLAGSAQANQKETVVYSFGTVADDGMNPQDGLIADRAGNLYGTTIAGGAFSKGTVFMITPGGAETVLYSFAGAPNDGAEPNSALAIDNKGILYGTTLVGGANGNGVVFRFDPAHGQEQVLYSFCVQTNCADGSTPIAPVTVGKKGVLYGTTAVGGQGAVQASSGIAFRLDPPGRHGTAWTESVLYNFCSQTGCADGKNPGGGRLLLAQSGVLYGTASAGQQGGTLFAINPGGSYQVLHVFTTGGSNDGVTPKNGVIADKNGTLYGTTSAGGLHSCGTAYSYDPSSFVYQSLYSFCSQANDPTTIYGGLTLVENKRGATLYGTGLAGGTHGHGALYSLTPPTTLGAPWNETTLHSFCPHIRCRDGATPAFATLLNVNGEFYGMTTGGGSHGGGIVYRYGKP